MTKIEWLELAKEAIAQGRGDKAIKYINEVIELLEKERHDKE